MTALRILSLVSLAAAALSTATPVLAADSETRYGLVSTEGLDLTTASGQAALAARVKQEASALCGTPDYDDQPTLAAIRRCRAGAIRSAAAQIASVSARAMAQATQPTQTARAN